MDDGGWPEALGKADLVLFAQLLFTQQDDQVVVPGGEDLCKGLIIDLAAQVDADDLGAQCRGQRVAREGGRMRVDSTDGDVHWAFLHWALEPAFKTRPSMRNSVEGGLENRHGSELRLTA